MSKTFIVESATCSMYNLYCIVKTNKLLRNKQYVLTVDADSFIELTYFMRYLFDKHGIQVVKYIKCN